MKTLADLKRQAKNFEWSLQYNSWFPHSTHLKEYRKVAHISSVSIGFHIRKADGLQAISYLDWPKAKQLSICDVTTAFFESEKDRFSYKLTLTRDCADNQLHTMIYHLKPIEA